MAEELQIDSKPMPEAKGIEFKQLALKILMGLALTGVAPWWLQPQFLDLYRSWAGQRDIELKSSEFRGPIFLLGTADTADLKTATKTQDGIGRYRQFAHGAIYWTKQTGSHAIRGAIYAKWKEMGAETSLLGYPTSDEEIAPDYGKHGDGRISHFQNGLISWTEQTGAHEIHGAILRKWMSMGQGLSYLGYPITDEQDAPGGGRISHFQHGWIYWTEQTGAHEVHGAIVWKWQNLQAKQHIFLGYPTSDEEVTPQGDRLSYFQYGSIHWSEQTGPHEVHGAINAVWKDLQAKHISLGVPITDEQDVPAGGRISHFQHGTITLTQDGRISISWVQAGCGWTQTLCNTPPKT